MVSNAMQGKKVKVVFSDNNVDKAVTGYFIKEDDFFFVIQGVNGKTYNIGKKSVVCIEGDYNAQ